MLGFEGIVKDYICARLLTSKETVWLIYTN